MWKGRNKQKIVNWLIVVFIGFVLLVFLFSFYMIFIVPSQNPDGKFTKENILKNLNGESRVLYSDGVSIIGAFFEINHRLYVPYDSIPQTKLL